MAMAISWSTPSGYWTAPALEKKNWVNRFLGTPFPDTLCEALQVLGGALEPLVEVCSPSVEF